MFNSEKNEISFPHVIPGNKFDGKIHTFNSIDGGTISLSSLNLIRNRFLGGNIEFLGLMKLYGIYACPHYETKIIYGFYIPNPETLTKLGKNALLKHYPGATITGMTMTKIKSAISEEEKTKKAKLIVKAVELGAMEADVNSNTIDELDGLIRSLNSGKAKSVEIESLSEQEEKTEKIQHVKAKPNNRKK